MTKIFDMISGVAKIFAKIQRPSLRWGLIFGIILGVVETVYNFAVSFVTLASIQPVLDYIPAILFVVLSFYSGLRASRETGKWVSGLITGIWVALIATILAYIIPAANTLINLQSIVASSQLYLQTHPVSGMKPSDFTASDVLITLLLELLVSIVNCAFFTVVGGGLGGFVGRRRALALATSAGQAYTETFFEPPASEPPASDTEDQAADEDEEKAQHPESRS